MRIKYLLLFIVLVSIAATSVWAVFGRKDTNGRVLGTSINNFYSGKLAEPLPPPQKNGAVSDPKILAKSAILIHEPSKYPLYAKGENETVPVASLTKIMTALVSLDTYSLSDEITVKKENTEIIPSVMELRPDEKITVESLMYGLLISSGNDAAKALASGKMSETEFISKMNLKAKELGLGRTQFKDPAGLDDQGRSSAMDVALLFSYALKNETIQRIVSTPEKEVFSTDGKIAHNLKNSNRLVTGEIPLDGVIGGKTGYTPDAGHTLVCAASRNGQTLISVILNTSSNSNSASAEETQKLLSWGFESYKF